MNCCKPLKFQTSKLPFPVECRDPGLPFNYLDYDARAYAETYIEQAARDGLTYRQAAGLFRYLAQTMEQRPMQMAIDQN